MLSEESTLDRYVIKALLGRGGTGEVYRAYDTLLERDVALKTMRADKVLASDERRALSEAESRFLREARASARLRHASVVTIYDVGLVDGVPFIAMELVEGKPLRSYLLAATVPLATRLGWLIDVASALATAHAHGLVHRDVKPENVMIADDGRAKVLDFGIARRAPNAAAPGATALGPPSSDGQVRGTLRYMAPEQLAGAAVDPRADQYAWGVVAYELLCGRHPADAAGLPAQCPAAMVANVQPLVSSLSPGLGGLLLRALAPRSEMRFASMDEIVVRLEAEARVSPVPPIADTASASEPSGDAMGDLDPSAALRSTRTLPSALGPEGAPSDALHPEISEGALLGERYRVLGELGRGGSGIVYRARDLKAREIVALKLLRWDGGPEGQVERFWRELQMARKVTHANVVRIHDLVELPGRLGLSMELVEGESLGQRIARGPLSRDEWVTLALDLAKALAAAHDAGVVHRDLKPANVLIRGADGHAVVTDFGVSRALHPEGNSTGALSVGLLEGTPMRLTVDCAIVGTPQYMAPEQLDGAATIGPAADVYALGLVLFEAATGARPHDGRTVEELRRLRHERLPSALRSKRSDLPAGMCTTVDRALAVAPDDRFSSGVELLAALSEARPGAGATRPRVRGATVAAALGVGAASALGLVLLRHPAAPDPAPAIALTGSGPAIVASAPGKSAAAPLPLTRVLLFGIENQTKDPLLDGTTDAVLVRALYRSRSVDPVGGRDLAALAAEVEPGASIDEHFAQKLSARTAGRIVTVRGAVKPVDTGYSLSLTAADATTQTVVLEASRHASSLARVVPTLGLLASDLRRALGESVPSEPEFAEQTGMSVSVEADHEYTLGRDSANDGDYPASESHLTRALSLDPEFALAHATLGLTQWSASERSDANTQLRLAFKWIDRMGEREQLKFLCDYYATFGEYDKAIPACQELLAKWPGDLRTEINLSVTHAQRGDAKSALDLGTRVAAEHPRNVVARVNVVNFLIGAGELDRAESEGLRLFQDFGSVPPIGYDNLGAASTLLGHRDLARQIYEKVAAVEPTMSAYGLIDLAFAEGRLDDAARAASDYALATAAEHEQTNASAGFAVLAEVRLRRADREGARAAAERVISKADDPRLLYLAGSVCVAAGCETRALALAGRLEQSLSVDERVYGSLLRAEALRLGGRPRDAVTAYEQAAHVQDTWFGRYGLARAYLDLHAYPEAYGELQKCLTRRGEAANFFLPSAHLVPPVTYYLARAREGIGSADASATYEAFLAMEPEAQHDPLADDARRRARSARAGN